MNKKAKELDLNHRIYVGPVDAKTRSICLEWVGNVYTETQLEDMDNGTTGNALTERGGWGCRHQWVPVDKEFADQLM
jgi:hypothetical protein